jgi:hypothetical protein
MGSLSDGSDAALGPVATGPSARRCRPSHLRLQPWESIRHIEGNRFSLAEIDGSKSERILRVSEDFGKAGFKAPVVSDVR